MNHDPFGYLIFLVNRMQHRIIFKQKNDFFSQVPPDFTFVQVVDMFIKIHKIFNFKYNSKIKQFMLFLEHYLLKVKESFQHITPRNRETAKKMKLQ